MHARKRDKSCGHVILDTLVACNTLSFEIISLPFPLSLRSRYSSLRHLNNTFLSILLFLVHFNLSRPSSNLGTLSHVLRDSDDPTTVYSTPGKIRHIVSVTLTIQQIHMALQENVITFFP